MRIEPTHRIDPITQGVEGTETPQQAAERLRALAELGISHVIVELADAWQDDIFALVAEVMAAVASV